MQDALRTYLELAMGLTEVSRKKVKRAVKDAVGKGGATAEQLKALTTEVVMANSANRDAMVKLVRFEVDRALGIVGLATAEEVAELNQRVRRLEKELADARATTPGAAEPAHRVGASVASAPPSTSVNKLAMKTAKKALPTADKLVAEATPATGPGTPAGVKTAIPTADKVAKSTAATKATATKKAAAKKTAATKAAPTKTAPTKTAPTTAAAKKTVAKKTVAKKAPAKKAQP
jgi:polyhydroxyalkanoate synthesis regulator phasin